MRQPSDGCMPVYIHVCMYICIYIYIYIERERGREKERYTYCTYIHVCMYHTCIAMHVHTDAWLNRHTYTLKAAQDKLNVKSNNRASDCTAAWANCR